MHWFTFVWLYFMGVGMSATFLSLWFYSTLPIHVCWRLKRFGLWKDNAVWHQIPEWETTWTEWADSITLYCSPFWSTLLTCKYCLATHVSWWTFIVLFFCNGVYEWPTLGWFIIAAANSPSVVLFFTNRIPR